MGAKTALITGITGQDGAILAKILLEKGYNVHGLRPYLPVEDTVRLSEILDDITLHYADMADTASLTRVLAQTAPDEIYNLAGMSHVQVSFGIPELTAQVNGLGVVRLMESMRAVGVHTSARLYQASSSEMFGNAPSPQNELTPMHPCSPYGAAKLYGYHMVRIYRESYGFYATNGILFNHESADRGVEFVTRKITAGIAAILSGHQEDITLGNLDARRDWGHAKDYMRGAWMMLQQDTPDDYILATGVTHSVRDFARMAFAAVGIDLIWHGAGREETGRDCKTGRILVRIDPSMRRPHDISELCGDSGKARRILGWAPQYSFQDLIAEMMTAESITLPQAQKLYA